MRPAIRPSRPIDLDIEKGEIFALLGPNGAGKTTLISIICGIVNPSTGGPGRRPRRGQGLPRRPHQDRPGAAGAEHRRLRDRLGHGALLARPVRQAPQRRLIEKILRDLSLWDKKDAKIMTLSGGMKRRVMIAKALSHEPTILFLDEPTAGVDVELRRDMWEMVRKLRESGVTIILTTHYIEEAEEMADRIGVISKGEIILVEDKDVLMRKLGKKQLTLQLQSPLAAVPAGCRAMRWSWRPTATSCLHLRRPGRGDRHRRPAQAPGRTGRRLQGPAHQPELAGRNLRQPGEGREMNVHAIKSIYRFEMARWFRTLAQSIIAPVLSTSLYFVVFGSAIGSRMQAIDGVSYGAFIIPGLIMLSLLGESISNASFGIYMPKWAGTIYELLSAPVAWFEAVTGYVGAAATKSICLGLLILATARIFVPFEIAHPFVMLLFLVLTAVTFSLFGFVIGVWADNFQKLQIVPALMVTPLTFLGGSFYSIKMLPPIWQKITLFNPVVYLISGFRWSFYGQSDVGVGVSLGMTAVFLVLCLTAVGWIFKTGYRLKV
jgi:ABC-2 type transport system permease protein